MKKSWIGFLLLASLSASASAATIVWGGAMAISSSTDVSTAGSLVRALDFQSGTAIDRTINTVPFEGYTSVAGGNSGSFNLAGAATNGTWGGGTFAGYGIPSLPASPDNTVYAAALNDGMYVEGVGSYRLETLMGLTPGKVYQVQVWFYDNRNTTSMKFGSTSNLGTEPGTVSLASSGAYAIGTFTADATGSQLLSFQEQFSKEGATINLFQIRDITSIPEPSALLLAGLGLLAFSRRRR